jgi:hypothetical protein
MQLRIFITLLLTIAGITANIHAADMPDDFIALNKIYLTQVTKLKNIQKDDLKNIGPNYLADLKNIEKAYQASGELSPLLIVRKEYNRFKANPNISEITQASTPADLVKLQKNISETQKKIKIKCAESIIDLSKRYKKRLISLQKTLTKSGNLDDAIKIMNEIESINSYPEIMAAQSQIDAGGTLAITPDKPIEQEKSAEPEQTIKELNKESLSNYFHTRITRWNSITHEITCSYNFSSEKQLEAWSNASFDNFRNRLLCDNAISWLKPLFSSIKKIECDTYYFEGEGPIRVMLGKSLYADLLPTADGKAILHQGNPSYPIQKSYGGAEPYRCYNYEITINGKNVQWTVGQRTLPQTKLLKPISRTIRVGLGAKNSKTMFNNIKITGILSPITIRAIEGR